MRITSFSLLASGALIGGHAAWSPPAHAQAESVGDSATTGTQAASTYYAITADVRRCAFPACGGWFVKQLNQPTTTCHDGRTAEQCYTPVLDWANTDVPESQQTVFLEAARTSAISGPIYAIVRGALAPTNTTTPRPELGQFIIAEAWLADGEGGSEGTFVHVKDNGLRCLVAPCPNLTETTLNTAQVTNIADVDFAPAALSDSEIAEYTDAMYGPDGILVAGDRYTVRVDGRTADGRTATQPYQRLGADTAP